MGLAPNVSIVILTKNAGRGFRATLRQIYDQQTNLPFELIIVDSGSTDESLEIVSEFPIRKFTIQPHEFNFGLTRNYGFSLSHGEYIITLSQDATPYDRKWLDNLIRPFLVNPNVVAVQGATRFPMDKPVFYWEKSGAFYFTSETKRWGGCEHSLSFVNCAIRRTFWESHPIKYTPFSEDKLFARQVQAAGCRIVEAKDAICLHGHEYTFRTLVKRLLAEGIGWRYAGVEYSLKDCFGDILENKWMIRVSLSAFWRREMTSLHELLFLFVRPICIFWGNRKVTDDVLCKAGPDQPEPTKRQLPETDQQERDYVVVSVTLRDPTPRSSAKNDKP
jgi:rhamnosyltransferase